MPFTRNIELGRVCLVNLACDPLYGKLVVIVDFVDMNRVLVDSPNITRCVISLRRLAITSLVVDLQEQRTPDAATLAAAMKACDVEGQWAGSAWGKKIAKQAARKNLSDFDRYKVMVARVKRSALIKKALK
eukprot:CAMPEP_0197585574 /NCGR_PEP_ID=MMETSP1326-20131121/7827_1 /TAXON_ID=1155430 /ORGANISM="Genus nov. species nov., Strain RCC2288" /LENGTH=130 /DNA_ID=CAMNT_0043150095 /DNA_START=35 /DNA_END=427 /DNA_ORIENTATION=+